VSLYNETEGQGIFPTPTVGMVGLVEPVDRTCSSRFRSAGDVILLVGAVGAGSVGGSEYLAMQYSKEAGRPPPLDLEREKKVQRVVRSAVREGLLSSAHDCSEGGLAVALAESCVMGDPNAGEQWLGAAIRVPFITRKDFALFGEDASRVVVSCPPSSVPRLQELAREAGAPLVQLGAVGGDRLEVQGALSLPVAELAAAWRSGIPNVLQKATRHFVRAVDEQL
jgi:phosphoribosylformylglycinamidine (FGAM) synthase-like enzyme